MGEKTRIWFYIQNIFLFHLNYFLNWNEIFINNSFHILFKLEFNWFNGTLNSQVLISEWKIFNNSKSINLINKNITEIMDETFVEFENLTSLTVASNQLERISSNAFKSLFKLLVLDLIANQLTSLDEHVFNDLKSLSRLDLSFNLLLTKL